ncbi:MAG: CoA pyrophosphatase [Anaerolineales bacterium]|nr:CoA pyrophosphatase [Anaerolineales bacterium]
MLTENYIARRLKEAYQPGLVASTDGYAALATSQSGQQLTCAAVLMPLAWKEDEWHLLFTRRTKRVENHKGQVSFPGGACEAGETAEQTALRESMEEIGLQQADVRVLGRLNDVVTITHYRVAPLVGVIPWPYRFRLSPVEVGCVFLIPLIWLTQRENWEEHLVTLDGTVYPFPVVIYHKYDGEVVWGATARMVQNLIKVVFE